MAYTKGVVIRTIYSIIFERGGLRELLSKDIGGGLHEGAAYMSQYGIYIMEIC